MSSFGAVQNRFQQGRDALAPDRGILIPAGTLDVLSPVQQRAFCRLLAFDQRHLVDVHRRVTATGKVSSDLEVAALLHDLAKGGTATQPGRCHVAHRVAAVLLDWLPSGGKRALGSLPAPPWRAGLALALNHAHLGADEAARLGCSLRTCWLIRHHHDPVPGQDGELRCLIAADRDRT